MVSNDAIRQSAKEVVDRMGTTAVDYVRGRITELERAGTPEHRDQAWLLLNEVERILEER